MLLISNWEGSVLEFILEVLLIIVIAVFVFWRLGISASNANNILTPFQKAFYNRLIAKYYEEKSTSILGRRPILQSVHKKRIDLLTKSINTYPTARVYTKRAHVYLNVNRFTDLNQDQKEENFERAIQDLETALELEPGNPIIINQYMHKFFWTKYWGEFASFDDLPDTDKKELQRLADRAVRLIGSDYVKDEKKRDDIQNVYEQRAYISLKQYRFKEVIKDCNAALKIGLYQRVHRMKIISLIYQGYFEEALQEYQDAMTVNPHYFKPNDPLLSSIKKLVSLSNNVQVTAPELLDKTIGYFELQSLSKELRANNSAIMQLEQMFADPNTGFNVKAY